MKNIVIYGSSGWLGKSTIEYFENNYRDKAIYLLGRNLNLDSDLYKNYKNTYQIHKINQIKNLEVDLFFYFSFVTQEKLLKITEEEYVKLNEEIINNFKIFSDNNLIKKALLTSSGAIYWENTSKDNLYSKLKRMQENEFSNICENQNIQYQISRIFALTSSKFNFEKNYAFTNFIEQANKNNKIIVNNPETSRSYLKFENLIKFFVNNNSNLIYDAWNENLTMRELATRIGLVFNDIELIFNNIQTEEDLYLSTDTYFTKQFSDKENLISIDYLKKIIF